MTALGSGYPRDPNRESWAPRPHPHRAHVLFRKARFIPGHMNQTSRTPVQWVRNKGSIAELRGGHLQDQGRSGHGSGDQLYPRMAVKTMEVLKATLMAQTCL